MPAIQYLQKGVGGHLGKQLIDTYGLDVTSTPQHYGIGLKELWQIPAEKHRPGLVQHGAGWPLAEHGASGGSFLYHLEDCQVALGLIVDLNYSNPFLSPFDEFQRFKHHPTVRQYLDGGERLAYGAGLSQKEVLIRSLKCPYRAAFWWVAMREHLTLPR
ncbi:MAG: hypothetical protein CM1200mP41_07070 [Gammaproteobacteria bacterium]|nr:MAG: hypothetical protein CM1200mP41_07070 [Gammaproteobacteria bacterium]